ncbi:MAG TPA: hypothetical protein VHT34_04990 [Clostridia bacterium]|nr:hypothetical protein [Clostridia bacterium]
MCNNKSCYLCKNLVFFDSVDHKGYYYCTLTDKKYIDESTECNCASFFIEEEE